MWVLRSISLQYTSLYNMKLFKTFQNKQAENNFQIQIKQEPEGEPYTAGGKDTANTKIVGSDITLLSSFSNGTDVKTEKKKRNKDNIDNSKKHISLEQEKVSNKLIALVI